MYIKGYRIYEALRGVRILSFLLAVFLTVFIISVVHARPMHAEPLNELACSLRIADDCMPPTTPELAAPANGAFLKSNDATATWSASSDDVAVKEYEICAAPNPEFTGAACGRTAETSWPLTNLPTDNATWYWRVRAHDQYRAGDWSATNAMTIDTDNPVVTLSSQSATLIGGTRSVFSTNFKITDAHLRYYAISIVDGDGKVVYFEERTIEGTEYDGAFSWDVSTPLIPSGTYSFNVIARDASERVGNAGALLTVDNDGPAATVTGGNVIINSGSLTPKVALTDANDIASFAWTIDRFSPPSVFDPSVLQPIFSPSDKGTYLYYLTLTDALGNISVLSFTFDYAEVLEPIVAPIAPIDNKPVAERVVPVTRIATVAPDVPTRNNAENTNTNSVLGNSIIAADAPPADVAAVASTGSGWSILGFLWYWWLVVIALLGMITLFVRRYLLKKRVAPTA